MANICKYLIRAKGTKKAVLMVYSSTPKAGDFDENDDEAQDESFDLEK